MPTSKQLPKLQCKETITISDNDWKLTIRRQRKQLCKELMDVFGPYMWESGFQTGPDHTGSFKNSRPLKLWAPKDSKGKITVKEFNGFCLTTFYGISENGIITDAFGGGCVTEDFDNFPVEDLFMLKSWATKIFGCDNRVCHNKI